MKTIFEKIKFNPLFNGIELNDFEAMLKCIDGHIQTYSNNSIIQLAGDPITTIGLVVEGCVHVVRDDSDGRQNLMTELNAGELFGEVLACAGVSHSPVSVIAVEQTRILHLNYRKVITACSSACVFHQRLIENMLTLVAQKTIMLNQKIEILSKRTTRQRLMLFFDLYRHGSATFTIPFNRDELAAYLCVERSAMSAELSKMQHDGIIRYKKSDFEIL